jgi:hypothetical protein
MMDLTLPREKNVLIYKEYGDLKIEKYVLGWG